MMLNENPNITDVFSEGCTGVRVQISSNFLASQGLTYLPCARLQVYNLTSVHHCQAKPLRIRQRVLADWIWLPFPHRKLQYLNKMLRMQTLCQATSMISMMSMDVIGLCLQRHPEPAIGSPGISQRSRNEKTPRRICWSIEAVFQREAMVFLWQWNDQSLAASYMDYMPSHESPHKCANADATHAHLRGASTDSTNGT